MKDSYNESRIVMKSERPGSTAGQKHKKARKLKPKDKCPQKKSQQQRQRLQSQQLFKCPIRVLVLNPFMFQGYHHKQLYLIIELQRGGFNKQITWQHKNRTRTHPRTQLRNWSHQKRDPGKELELWQLHWLMLKHLNGHPNGQHVLENHNQFPTRTKGNRHPKLLLKLTQPTLLHLLRPLLAIPLFQYPRGDGGLYCLQCQ